MAAEGHQRFAPGQGTPWVYGPGVIPPPLVDGANRHGRVELLNVIDKMLDWTRNAGKLPDEYWVTTKEEGHDTTELHTTVLKAVESLFKKPYCQFAPICFATRREDVFYFPEDMIRVAGNEKGDQKY